MTDDRLHDEDVRDSLPTDLNVSEFVGPYQFPDNSRRRVPGYIYLAVSAVLLVVWLTRRGDAPVLVNGGFVLAAVLLASAGAMCLAAGWRLALDEKQALAKATGVIGFPVGHASAQMAWRGLRSRPTWRILAYSGEDPPTRRAFVLIDAIDGSTVEHLVEDNPEDWALPTSS